MLKDVRARIFWGEGDLEKSRFDWVFLNDGVPKTKTALAKSFDFILQTLNK